METKYTYRALEFLNLTSFPFQESYLIPGIIDSRNEALVIGALSQVGNFKKQKNLDALLGISRPAITMLTTEMIEKGLIIQETNPDDRRGYILSLTDLGKKIATWMIYRKQVLNKIQLKGFSKEEIKTFNNLATKMAQNMLDISERELKHLPKFDESADVSEWDIGVEAPSLISEEDQKLLITLARKAKKLNKDKSKEL